MKLPLLICRSDNDDDDDEDNQVQKAKKLSLKKKGIGSEASAERMSKEDANLQLLNPAEQERHLQKQKRRRVQGREDEVMIFCMLYGNFHISHAMAR